MTHAEEGYGSCLESLVVSGDETIVAARLTELLEAGLDELLVMTVQVAAPSGECGYDDAGDRDAG